MLPATQPAVERRAIWKQLDEARKEALQQLQEARRGYLRARSHYEQSLARLHLERDQARASQEPVERRTFVAACPREECKGFLSNHYKCGACLRSFCSACREEKLQGATHECDEATVATIRAILSDSRPCPGCGMSINRVSGCDQMYCTLCDVAFSYRTGLRIQGVIHNPHYFERLRQLRAAQEAAGGDREDAGEPARAARPEEQGCGAWPSLAFLSSQLISSSVRRLMSSFHRTATNIQHVYLARMANFRRQRADNEDLRVAFCLQEIGEDQFKQRLEQRERRRDLDLDAREVLETFVLTCMELAFRLREHVREGVASQEAYQTTLLQHCQAVKELVNEPLLDICKRFKVAAASIRVPELEEKIRLDEDLFHAPEWLRRGRGV